MNITVGYFGKGDDYTVLLIHVWEQRKAVEEVGLKEGVIQPFSLLCRMASTLLMLGRSVEEYLWILWKGR